jgi:hypothetical protein
MLSYGRSWTCLCARSNRDVAPRGQCAHDRKAVEPATCPHDVLAGDEYSRQKFLISGPFSRLRQSGAAAGVSAAYVPVARLSPQRCSGPSNRRLTFALRAASLAVMQVGDLLAPHGLSRAAHYVPLGARFSRGKLADFGSPDINHWHNTISRPSSSRAICLTLIVGLPDFNTTISPGVRCSDMLGSNTA